MADNHELAMVDISVDDCWNRIGVYGDKSCERLAEHIHCRNCEVHAAAAINLLERYASLQEEAEPFVDEAVSESRSLLVFRLADEWLAVATARLIEVVEQVPIHSLPHQRSRSLLGVANVHGSLVACVSLAELLGIAPSAAPAGSGARVTPRMLIVAAQGGSVVVPVDEVDGIHAVPLQCLQPAAGDGGLAVSQLACGVVQWRGRSITQLDDALVSAAISRSLV